MNSDLVKNIISLAASIISLIILILSLLQTRTERTTSPIDSPSLKLIAIDRIIYSKSEAVKIINDRIRNYIALTGSLITSNGLLIYLSVNLIIFYITFLTIMLISVV